MGTDAVPVSVTPVATEAVAIPAPERSSRPYAPGWLDLLGAWIHSRPWPAWLTYATFGVVGILISNAQNWLTAGRPAFTIEQTAWGIVTVGFFVLRDYLNQLAGEAFDDFRPALSHGLVDDDRYRYELTTNRCGRRSSSSSYRSRRPSASMPRIPSARRSSGSASRASPSAGCSRGSSRR